jgi:membrane associated rhomboid family serine protease
MARLFLCVKGPMSYLVLAVFAGAAWYFMTTEDRGRFVVAVRGLLDRLRAAVVAACFIRDPLSEALRARTRWIIVVPAITAINITLFVCMMVDAAAVGHAEAMVAWGANFAPRTGNGEWWRLVSATFLHVGVLPLLINTGALISAGRVLERLVGPVTFATIYVVAGILGALASLWISAVAVTAGASAALFGMYGLLLACWMWGAFRRSTATVRLASVKALAVPAVIFICYNLATRDLEKSAEITGVVSGFIAGLLLTRSAAERKPRLPRVAAAAASAAVIVFVLSEPVRGVVDPRPDIAAVLTMEQRTAARYDGAVARFRKGTVTSRELAMLIERTIIPQVQVANVRINALGRVPAEHRDVLAEARDYLRLREEAWRLRAGALLKASLSLLRDADKKEQLALSRFDEFSASAERISASAGK